MSKTPIERLMDAASQANVIHFPQGVLLRRNNGKFEASFVTRDGSPSTVVKCGTTPEGALDALRQYVAEQLVSQVASAKRDSEKYSDALALLTTPEVTR